MNKIIQEITNNGPRLQIITFVILFIVCWNIENLIVSKFQYKKWKHAFTNFPFILTAIPGQALFAFALVNTIQWTTLHHFGFLYHLHLSNHSFLLFITSFIFLDLGEYVYHVIMHKVKRLWMFHVVHHSDNMVDLTTTIREHPGENIIRLSFTLLWVFLSGTLFWVLILRQLIQVFTTLFAHMNYRIPDKYDKIIGYIFITPNLHQVHHHYKQPYTDSNYGDVFSVWDRFFGTFKRTNGESLKFGIDTYMDKKEIENFKSLVVLPFGKYRHRSEI